MALLILALLQRIFLMSSLMLLLVWLIFFMVLIKLLPILGTISGRSEERFSRNAETDLVCRLLLEKKNTGRRCSASLCRFPCGQRYRRAIRVPRDTCRHAH